MGGAREFSPGTPPRDAPASPSERRAQQGLQSGGVGRRKSRPTMMSIGALRAPPQKCSSSQRLRGARRRKNQESPHAGEYRRLSRCLNKTIYSPQLALTPKGIKREEPFSGVDRELSRRLSAHNRTGPSLQSFRGCTPMGMLLTGVQTAGQNATWAKKGGCMARTAMMRHRVAPGWAPAVGERGRARPRRASPAPRLRATLWHPPGSPPAQAPIDVHCASVYKR